MYGFFPRTTHYSILIRFTHITKVCILLFFLHVHFITKIGKILLEWADCFQGEIFNRFYFFGSSDYDICGQLWINSLDRPSIDMPSTSWSTLSKVDRYLGWQLVNSRLIFADTPLSVNWCIWVGWHSANYWPLSIDSQLRCWSSANLVLTKCQSSGDQVSIKNEIEGRLRVSIDTWLSMPFVHMIHFF